jgi:hypothetical protein
MTNGESLEMAIDATQRMLERRLHEALTPHRDPLRPRDRHAATDSFVASASRHLAASEAVLVSQVKRTVPGGRKLSHDYLAAARGLEHALVRIKGKLYGEAHLIHLTWPSLWADARRRLDEHSRLETCVVEELLRYGDPLMVDGLARRMFDVEAHGPTRPHPRTPHTGLLGSAARRMWALADRFWDAAEGRVIPEPVQSRSRRHDSLIAQYLVADPHFDASASILSHRRQPQSTPIPDEPEPVTAYAASWWASSHGV